MAFLRNLVAITAFSSSPLSTAVSAGIDFTGFPTLDLGTNAAGLVAADFDGNGSLDLAVTNWGGDQSPHS
jgi:hypothetical protein